MSLVEFERDMSLVEFEIETSLRETSLVKFERDKLFG
jgi:hypothetical protein